MGQPGGVTVLGLDDTDSREGGMCTTYLAARIADRLAAAGGTVEGRRLVRLNPAVEYKTRGNAALSLHIDTTPEETLAVARRELDALAVTDDPRTNPGLVVAPGTPRAVPVDVSGFARRALHDHLTPEAALDRLNEHGYAHEARGNGRGLVGALAAVGAGAAFAEWTYEYVAYRPRERWGTDREVDPDSVFAAAEAGYPRAWDTVDRTEGQTVCVPHTPGPVLFGIRGDDPEAVRETAARIDHEPTERTALFCTNQGTDAHLQSATLDAVEEGRAYRVTGDVAEGPDTRRGGHVHLTLAEGDATLECVAFEPTKRFRDRVRALRAGDRVTACGEVGDGTLKLEKFAVRSLCETERVTPTCPDCGRSMESAGRNQGYRCRDCSTRWERKVERSVDRGLELGWYEVPPCARRHVAKPLIRGGFDAPVHPER